MSFKGYSIVSCGILNSELNYLKNKGFLDADKILYTAPGLHENPRELKKQLERQLDSAKEYSENIIVVYGEKCYINTSDPARDIDRLIEEKGNNIKRIRAKNCIDMLCSIDKRQKISSGQNVYWLSSGWLQYQKQIFKDWDTGKANETFPQHDKAVVLDALGIYEEYAVSAPEKILEFADWMKLNIEPYKISLNRLKRLLLDEVLEEKEN